MRLAEAASQASTSYFDYFDIFVIVFTILIGIGVLRSLKAPQKNKFAIGFGMVSLIVFIVMDVVMIKNWMA